MLYAHGSVILAPLSGYTDIAFRNSARRHGCRFAFTEMIDAGALVFNMRNTAELLERGAGEEWLGIQIVGADMRQLSRAAEILNDYRFEVFDFNLGCPVRKVMRKGEGAALGAKPSEAARALETIAKISRHPVTAKIRILSAEDPAPTISLAKMLRDAGATALTVHGRTVRQMYSGPVAYGVISAVRESVGIQVVANGGIVSAASYARAASETGCDAFMVATGAMGNPWLFREIAAADKFVPPDAAELAHEIRAHVAEVVERNGEERGLRISRKIILDYISGRGYGGEIKRRTSTLASMKELEDFISEIARGPSPRYWKWLEANPGAPRRLR